jgi:hypothetical protein
METPTTTTVVRPTEKSRPVRRPSRRDFVLLFLGLLALFAYASPRWNDWNQNSRLSLVRSIVDKGTVQIDGYAAINGDFAFFNGHYYSDKPPGPALAGVIPYLVLKTALSNPLGDWLLQKLETSSSFSQTFTEGSVAGTADSTPRDKLIGALARIWLSFWLVAVPVALMLCCFWAFAWRITGRYRASLVLTLGLALGTTLFPYSSLYYSNSLTAALLFISFFLLYRDRAEESSKESSEARGNRAYFSPRLYWLVGTLLGLSVISQYETVLIAGPLALYGLAFAKDWPGRFGRALWLVVGGLPPGMVLVIYDLISFKNPLPVGYEYSILWADRHSQGFMSLTYPHLDALWGLTFSPYRGIFLLSPFLLLAIPGFYFGLRRAGLRWETALCLWATIAFFLFTASSAMWWGGFTFGPRYLISCLPFMALTVALLVREANFRGWWGSSGWCWWLELPVALAILIVLPASLVGREWPSETVQNPLADYLWPRLFAGNFALNPGMALGLKGLWSFLPLLLIFGIIYSLVMLWPGKSSNTRKNIKVAGLSPEPGLGAKSLETDYGRTRDILS